MTDPRLRYVVDTNVTATANDANAGASPECVAASAHVLNSVIKNGHVFIDDHWLIIGEYRRSLELHPQREPRAGHKFFKWLLTHLANEHRVTLVPITPTENDEFAELPVPDDGTVYDPSDRKFLAVAAAHPEHPLILQSLDSKWWGWQAALKKVGVTIRFLCPREIAKKHDQKLGK